MAGYAEEKKDVDARMKLYDQVIKGTFMQRPNRFIAHVQTDEGTEVCHVKNTGRCKELLVPGAEVFLAVSARTGRKTRCDLVAVKKGELLINMDSQAPNLVAAEAMDRLFPGAERVRAEAIFGGSRLDFCVEQDGKRIFVEVKGVTLEDRGAVLFPDAPTERGVKHVRELEACVAQGHGAVLLFVIQMKGARRLSPNRATHPAFADALVHARQSGVKLLAYDCIVTPDSMTLDSPVPIVL